MKTRTLFATLGVAGALAVSAPLLAQPGNGNGKGPPPGKGQNAAQQHGPGKNNDKNSGKSYSSNPGSSHGNRPGNERHDGYVTDRSGKLAVALHFNDRQRSYVRDYYRNQFGMGNCPPGLAKKNNGCMPPGQAKKWRIGYPLGRDVIFYDLPAALVVELGPPPRGYRYARVADDILMLAVGTGLVVDAIASLSR